LFDRICKEGGEGVIAKKSTASYRGSRTKCWLKIKCIERQEFVIVGWMESDKRAGFRSLLLGARDKGKLTYVGKVGTGFSTQMLHDLMDRMKPLEVDELAGRAAPRRPETSAFHRARAGRRDRLRRIHVRGHSSPPELHRPS
jgi:ATP-dependent DNA ligase